MFLLSILFLTQAHSSSTPPPLPTVRQLCAAVQFERDRLVDSGESPGDTTFDIAVTIVGERYGLTRLVTEQLMMQDDDFTENPANVERFRAAAAIWDRESSLNARNTE